MTESATGTNGAAPQVSPLDLFKSAKNGSAPAKPQPVQAAKAIPETSEAEIPAIVAFDGEKEIRIPESAKFKREVEGEGEVEFTIKDLFNSHKTSRQIDREFSKLDKERKLTAKEKEEVKKAQAELQHIDSHIKAMADAITNGKPLEAVEIATKLAGKGKENTVEDLVKQAKEIADKFENMSEEEEAAFWKERKSKQDATVLEEAKSELAWKEYLFDLKKFTEEVKASQKITDQELAKAMAELQKFDEYLAKMGKPTQIAGKDGFQITINCAQWVLGGRFQSRIKNVINTISPEQVNNTKLISGIVELTDPNWSDADLADVVRGALEDVSTRPSSDSKTEVSKPVATKEVTQPKANPEGASHGASSVEKGAGPILSWKDMIRKHTQA